MWSDKYSDDSGEVPQQIMSSTFWNPFECHARQPQKSYKTNELDLSSFKTLKCLNQDPNHNKKHCIKYHNDNDRRRNPSQYNYKCDFCIHGRNCPSQDSCDLSHNKVEQLYHPNRYKSKYCQSKVEDCEYALFCTFAHSDDEINIPLKLHLITQDQNFWLVSYKTIWCPYIENHDRADCVYAHNAQDFRRDPTIYKYNPVDCPNWHKKKQQQVTTYEQGGCQQMANCVYCHGWKELEYHPQNYRTKRCLYGVGCIKRTKDCAYYHNEQDRRVKNVQKTDHDPGKKPPQFKSESNDNKKKQVKNHSHFPVPIIPDPLLASKSRNNIRNLDVLMKKKLQIGQPFEVFSSTSITNHTASGSRKMSETPLESSSMQNYVIMIEIQQSKQQQQRKDQSPKKNRTAPSTPVEQNVFILNYQDQMVEDIDVIKMNISLPYSKPLIFSTQFINLLNKYLNFEILSILQQNTINESKLMNMIDEELDQLIMLTKQQISVVKQVITEMKQDVEDFMKLAQF